MRMIRLDGSDIRECSRRCLRTVPDLDGCEISAQGVGKRLADQKQLVLCCLSAILFSSFLHVVSGYGTATVQAKTPAKLPL